MKLEIEILSEFILNFCGNLDNFKEFYEILKIKIFIENLNKKQEEYINEN